MTGSRYSRSGRYSQKGGNRRKPKKNYTFRSLDDKSWEALGRGLLNNDENISAVCNAVTLIADSIASLKPMLMRVDSLGKKTIIDRYDHPVWELLKKPCSYMDWSTFVSFILRSVLLYGNAYAVIREQELIPLSGRSVSVYVGERQLVYEASFPFGRQSQRLGSDEIIHFTSGARTEDGIMGIAPLDRCPSVRELATVMRDSVLIGFEQGVFPSLVFKVEDDDLEEEEIERLTAKLTQKCNAKDAFQRPLVISKNITTTDTKPTSNRDAQLIESRKMMVSEIARVYNLNESVLSQNEHATLANVREFAYLLHAHTLKPHIVRFQQAFSNALLEDNVELMLDQTEYTDGDINARRASVAQLTSEPILSADEAKQLLGIG